MIDGTIHICMAEGEARSPRCEVKAFVKRVIRPMKEIKQKKFLGISIAFDPSFQMQLLKTLLLTSIASKRRLSSCTRPQSKWPAPSVMPG